MTNLDLTLIPNKRMIYGPGPLARNSGRIFYLKNAAFKMGFQRCQHQSNAPKLIKIIELGRNG